jgi:hypothetical protein
MSPEVDIEVTISSLEFLNSIKVGVAPFRSYKNCWLR